MFLGRAGREKVGIVTEFVNGINLELAIRDLPQLKELENQLYVAKQIVSGMNFLHSLNPYILVKKIFFVQK